MRGTRELDGEKQSPAGHVKASHHPDPRMAYVYISLWISLSSIVILFNKYLLSFANFRYPITLTTMHMGFASLVCNWLVHVKVLEVPKIPSELYWRAVVPIGALFSFVLAAGNGAYLFLSVSFIQMLKALQPVLSFTVGNIFGTEQFRFMAMANIILIGVGVLIATYGEVNFVFFGVFLQGSAIVAEALRITIIQVMLQKKGVKLDPVSTLYYVAPCCFMFLLPSLLYFELGALMRSSLNFVSLSPLLLINCVIAFGLNLSVFLLIGKTSALTMNIAGVVKDWLLIALSVFIFNSAVTVLNLVGYGIAFVGVYWYNHTRRQKAAADAAKAVDEESNISHNK